MDEDEERREEEMQTRKEVKKRLDVLPTVVKFGLLADDARILIDPLRLHVVFFVPGR